MKREVMKNSNRGLREEKCSRRLPSRRLKLMKESWAVLDKFLLVVAGDLNQ